MMQNDVVVNVVVEFLRRYGMLGSKTRGEGLARSSSRSRFSVLEKSQTAHPPFQPNRLDPTKVSHVDTILKWDRHTGG